MKYVSIDIETTGLDRENDLVLEIGAVIEDTDKQLDFDEIPKYKAIINNGRISGSPYALNLNARIIEILTKIPSDKNPKELQIRLDYVIKHNILTPQNFALSFHTYLESKGYKKNNNDIIKILVAGKNFASFDKPFLEKLLNYYGIPLISFGHRCIDPANLYIDFEHDMEIPSLNTCLERAEIDDKVTHNALLDAWDVVRVLRKKY